MKLSQIRAEKIRTELSREEVNRIVYDNWTDDGDTADVAILLGGNPIVLPDRAHAAADLWRAGRVSYIMPTGGVKWETEEGEMTEAEYMALCLKKEGIPEEAVILENDARTTHENMVCCTLLMMRILKMKTLHKVYVVTSPSHLRRSLEYARIYLPRMLKYAGYTDLNMPDGPENWPKDPFYANRVYREAELIHTTVQRGWMADIEVGEET